VDAVGRGEDVAVDEGLRELDPQAPREVVVAGPRRAEGGGAGGLAQGPDRLGGGERGERLQDRDHLRGGSEPIVTMPARALDREQPGVLQAGQLSARGLRRHARLGRQDAGGQRAAVAERDQHARPGRIGEQGGRTGDVGLSARAVGGGHGPSMPRRHFRQRGSIGGPSLSPWKRNDVVWSCW
jgi:hypothetical protein